MPPFGLLMGTSIINLVSNIWRQAIWNKSDDSTAFKSQYKTEKHSTIVNSAMGLLPDTQNCRLRMCRERRERFPCHRLKRKPLVSDFSMRHARAVMHVGIANPRWRWKRSRPSRCMRNPQFYVSDKRPIHVRYGLCKTTVNEMFGVKFWTYQVIRFNILHWCHMSVMASQISSNSTVCLSSSLFRPTTMKAPKLHITSHFGGIHWWPVDSLHKRPLMWEAFPCHDVIMFFGGNEWRRKWMTTY